MLIQTSRFGPVNLHDEDIIEFSEGILGFNDLRNFVLLDDPNDEIFAWLQSCEVPQIAFPVLEPELFTTTSHIQSPTLFGLSWDRFPGAVLGSISAPCATWLY